MKVIMDERDLRRLEARIDAARTDLKWAGGAIILLLLALLFAR